MKKEPKNFCIIPWMHFEFDAGNVTPCCHTASFFEPVDFENDLVSTLNHERIKEIRKDFLNNKAPSACQNCFRNEKNGLLSEREKNNRLYKELISDVIEKKEIEVREESLVYADIRFSNICNQSCRVCSPYFSTLWNEDALKLGIINTPIIKKRSIEDIPELKNCKKFRFSGGEPLIDPEHKKYIERLSRRNDAYELNIEYNTNLDLDCEKLIGFTKLWKKFETITISVSLDHIERAKFEYIRSNGNWDRVKSNFDLLQKEHQNIHLRIQFTLSIFNIMDFPGIIDTFTKEYQLNPHDIEIYPLHSPDYYSMTMLPKKVKTEISEKITKKTTEMMKEFELADEYIILNKKLKNLMALMTASDNSKLIHVFKNKTSALDKIRGQTFSDTFPKLSNRLAQY
jgi:molybdenum cofactor biosynthesis enzyme MoaA